MPRARSVAARVLGRFCSHSSTSSAIQPTAPADSCRRRGKRPSCSNRQIVVRESPTLERTSANRITLIVQHLYRSASTLQSLSGSYQQHTGPARRGVPPYDPPVDRSVCPRIPAASLWRLKLVRAVGVVIQIRAAVPRLPSNRRHQNAIVHDARSQVHHCSLALPFGLERVHGPVSPAIPQDR